MVNWEEEPPSATDSILSADDFLDGNLDSMKFRQDTISIVDYPTKSRSCIGQSNTQYLNYQLTTLLESCTVAWRFCSRRESEISRPDLDLAYNLLNLACDVMNTARSKERNDSGLFFSPAIESTQFSETATDQYSVTVAWTPELEKYDSQVKVQESQGSIDENPKMKDNLIFLDLGRPTNIQPAMDVTGANTAIQLQVHRPESNIDSCGFEERNNMAPKTLVDALGMSLPDISLALHEPPINIHSTTWLKSILIKSVRGIRFLKDGAAIIFSSENNETDQQNDSKLTNLDQNLNQCHYENIQRKKYGEIDRNKSNRNINHRRAGLTDIQKKNAGRNNIPDSHGRQSNSEQQEKAKQWKIDISTINLEPRTPGVRFDTSYMRWVAYWSERGRPVQRYYSLVRYGDEAKSLALKARQQWERRRSGNQAPINNTEDSNEYQAEESSNEIGSSDISPQQEDGINLSQESSYATKTYIPGIKTRVIDKEESSDGTIENTIDQFGKITAGISAKKRRLSKVNKKYRYFSGISV